jgi:hypothetical protein
MSCKTTPKPVRITTYRFGGLLAYIMVIMVLVLILLDVKLTLDNSSLKAHVAQLETQFAAMREHQDNMDQRYHFRKAK